MTSPAAPRRSLLDIPFNDWFKALGLEPKEAYRVRQVHTWVFERRAKTFEEMSDLPQALREKWDTEFRLRSLVLKRRDVSAEDGTARLFFETADVERFSSVYLPAKGGEGARSALCLSSQIGCAWGCVFCASGRVPLERNLAASEIVEQVLWAEEAFGHKISSLLFMGMGEPLANFTNLVQALQILRSPLGLNFGARHVTVSTTGLVPQIPMLATLAPKVNLAISLHAADDETRKKLLPKSSAWPIKDLLKAAWDYQRSTGRGRVTFEYILIKGVNDSTREAQRLANLLRAKKAWINLIAYNPVAGVPYEAPTDLSMHEFARVLTGRGLFVRLRKPQGTDIAAGCGQLGEAGPLGRGRK
ncbi:MAG: 23S rRNA (adenine(2503)-C(2))-methyltransferase RlmN [Elusimicrobia bacterium]|nr:23S rRNA (adenine(2503)-C(2))-methyltransferase RlmN [Elusimicrobiota bacterium]